MKFNRREFMQSGVAFGLGVLSSCLPQSAQAHHHLSRTRKVHIQGIEGECLIDVIGPDLKSLGRQKYQGTPVTFESVPTVDELTNAVGGVVIRSGSNVNSKYGTGLVVPVYEAPVGHDLTVDFSLNNPGNAYYQLGIHKLQQHINERNIPIRIQPRVMICDTSLDETHPDMRKDLHNGMITILSTKPNQPWSKDDSHGTSATGLIQRLTAPLKQAEITFCPVAATDTYLQAITVGADQEIPFVNISMAFGYGNHISQRDYNRITDTKRYAQSRNTYIIQSNGNERADGLSGQELIAADLRVGALNNGGRVLPYTNYEPHIVAPTSNITALAPSTQENPPSLNMYTLFEGTSAAAPTITSLATILYAYTGQSPQRIIECLKHPDALTDIYAGSRYDGHGIPDALKAFKLLQNIPS